MKVNEIMSKNIVKVNSEDSVSKAAEIMDSKSIGSLLVENTGIITERDIVRMVAAGKDPYETLVKDIMSSNVVKADVNTTIEEASEILEQNKIRRLVITENNETVGILTIRDVNKNLRFLLAKRITEQSRPSYDKP
ncbi:CBS domain-containing protein [Candidatus Woesearchaeota archaeon]|nr:CBS domain-containing protein [Candidatus Woesearchaeota archaeon]|tara:strand:- start:763 stop:1170 length:408 start_codon:yes stop_codon:yes gene_type:complete